MNRKEFFMKLQKPHNLLSRLLQIGAVAGMAGLLYWDASATDSQNPVLPALSTDCLLYTSYQIIFFNIIFHQIRVRRCNDHFSRGKISMLISHNHGAVQGDVYKRQESGCRTHGPLRYTPDLPAPGQILPSGPRHWSSLLREYSSLLLSLIQSTV